MLKNIIKLVEINFGGSKTILNLTRIKFGVSQRKLFLAGTNFGGLWRIFYKSAKISSHEN